MTENKMRKINRTGEWRRACLWETTKQKSPLVRRERAKAENIIPFRWQKYEFTAEESNTADRLYIYGVLHHSQYRDAVGRLGSEAISPHNELVTLELTFSIPHCSFWEHSLGQGRY